MRNPPQPTIHLALLLGYGALVTLIFALAAPRGASTYLLGALSLAPPLIYALAAARMRQRALEEHIRRRDRVILQAERLKTLRAMSVAIIHELSQPLSTLSIEARYLAQLAREQDRDGELASVAALVARKTENLSTLVRRLRSFGARTGEQSQRLEVEELFKEVIGTVAPEAKAAGIRLEIRVEAGLAVEGFEVELQQALLNLLRNAFAASPNATVELNGHDGRDGVVLEVVNSLGGKAAKYPGMGVGKLVVEAIVEAHGGSLVEDVDAEQWRVALVLPRTRKRADA